jgi:hypothetical protein
MSFLSCSVREILEIIFVVEYKMINKNLQVTNKELLFPNRIRIQVFYAEE